MDDIDDLAEDFLARRFLLLTECADHRLRRSQDAKRCRQMNVDHRVPLLVGHLLDHVIPGITSVVDDDIQTMESGRAGFDEALGKVSCGNAAGTRDRFAPRCLDLVHDRLRPLRIEVVNDNACPFRRELECNRTADALTGTSDERDLTAEFRHRMYPPFRDVDEWNKVATNEPGCRGGVDGYSAISASPETFVSPYCVVAVKSMRNSFSPSRSSFSITLPRQMMTLPK